MWNILAQLATICCVAHLLHVVPVGNDAVFDGVLEGENTSLALSLIAYVGVLLTHADHHALVTRTTDDGRENCTGCVVAGEASLAHPGAVVDNQRSNVVIHG